MAPFSLFRARPRRFLATLAVAATILVAARAGRMPEPGSTIRAETAPDITLETLATGLPSLTSIVSAGDARLFLTEQSGRIVIWDGTRVLPAPFLDLSSQVSCCGEQGLLSVAFHPLYAANGLFFVDYTNTAGDTVIARYRASSGDSSVADPLTGVVLLTILQPFANHNGGQLQFGPDGYLYIGMGDGGSGNDPFCNAQRDESLLGKLLRIDVDANAGSPPFHGIPADNPFRGANGLPTEVWAKGLRNPWRFSFDRATGDLWIGDVGQDAREEIDFQPRGSTGGQNYGWKLMEGTICGAGGSQGCPTSPAPPPCGSPLLTLPVYEYPHVNGDCSVTGGYLYRGSAMPAFAGIYFYGDYCTGRLLANGQELTPRTPGLSTFGQDASGELYLGTTDGMFARILQVGAPPTATPTALPPTATPSPAPTPLDRATPALRPAPRRPTPRVVARPAV